jgi:hypothetical protein
MNVKKKYSYYYNNNIYNFLTFFFFKVWKIFKIICVLLDTTLFDKVCQWLVAGQWFSLSTLVYFINKSDHHNIAEILLKVVLNTIALTFSTVHNSIASSLIISNDRKPLTCHISHWQTLSHNVLSSIPRLSVIRTHVSGDRHRLHR